MDPTIVSRDPEIMSGALCFTGTRVPVKNLGKLLALAASGFDVFVTVDKNPPAPALNAPAAP
jgi:uncharacterized protein (DUF433 family)